MLIALLGVVVMLLMPMRVSVIGTSIMVLFFGLPGAMYVVTAVFMRRRQPWAVIVGLVVASLDGLFALLAFLGSLINVANSPVMSIITLLWVIAMAQLIYQLAKSPAAMRAETQYQPRGFEVLPMATRLDENK